MAEDSCYREKNIVKTFSAATDGDACNMFNPVKNVFGLGEFPPQAVTPCTYILKCWDTVCIVLFMQISCVD